ncbi:putative PHD type zinc finger protein with BAH domain-containing protein [Scheffersomyces spartinae]|uniref:PHD type zinc finger protein with BAH domain-containing protein n=1 Tax=Scheffersomyces spartinae TaxID=45513 RepID=A0A9P8AH88_9ASCO|nr:putative PHD type zinc finger protein with BAH domain-containing protein [Scheffersomyces spartinae]KAG7192448.1 putative PHD type zinc finger protein with BAH domain-containing protein [Scheffersomyces spartinae]
MEGNSKGMFRLSAGDAIYMVCEPPGEPYYIGKIKRFIVTQPELNITSHIASPKGVCFLMQWFYRPKDISKSGHDLRLLYSSMHTDKCPLMSFRGKVSLMLKSDIEEFMNMSLEEYASHKDHFYFDKLFDRYMLKFYDVILTQSLLPYADLEDNHSLNFIRCLHKRFEYIFVEPSRVKTLLNGLSDNTCHCDICGQWCSAVDSVSCGSCLQHYHMLCLDPPLMTMPKKGFTWSCGTCAKNDDLAFQSKRTLMLETNKATNESSLRSQRRLEDLQDHQDEVVIVTSSSTSLDSLTHPSDSSSSGTLSTEKEHLPKYETMASKFLLNDINLSLEERRLQEEWTIRYLGTYARLEDAVDVHDRNPYPRASTRLGYKHQAVYLPEYEDHPIYYYDGAEDLDTNNKRRGWGGRRRNQKSSTPSFQGKRLSVPKEFIDVDPKDYPQWLQPRPRGYIERGLDGGKDSTSTLMWKPVEEEREGHLTLYLESCAPKAIELGILPSSPNFMDFILKTYHDNEGDSKAALKCVSSLTREILREPTFSQDEIERFEQGIMKYGSELHPTYVEVKTQELSMVVRFYYLWKKTENGRRIWGGFKGRKKNKFHVKAAAAAAAPETYTDDNIEILDSISDNIKCKHCSTDFSVQWYKVTDTEPDNGMVGLCFRCAKLWRKYGVVWEDPITLKKKIQAQIQKRRYEYELMVDAIGIVQHSLKHGGLTNTKKGNIISLELSTENTPTPPPSKKGRPPKKKTTNEVKRSRTPKKIMKTNTKEEEKDTK